MVHAIEAMVGAGWMAYTVLLCMRSDMKAVATGFSGCVADDNHSGISKPMVMRPYGMQAEQ